MSISDFSKDYHARMFGERPSSFAQTDPELVEIFDNFAFDTVVNSDKMDDKTRFIAILAILLGSQSVDEFGVMVTAALNMGVGAVQIKEIVYQAIAYLGIGRIYPFLNCTNEVFLSRGIALPLEGQTLVHKNTRAQMGEQAQIEIFGESMRNFRNAGAADTRRINEWLVDNCFGDYYTRGGLDYAMREMITFCFLAAQGGCEPQLTSHAAANMRIGNDKDFLINVVAQCLPYIGYPRSLNALSCINNAAKMSDMKNK